MPYIKREDRVDIITTAPLSFYRSYNGEPNPGNLNYLFTLNILAYLAANGYNYRTFNDILGALEGAKQEFYRRIVVPGEEQKIQENGDVY